MPLHQRLCGVLGLLFCLFVSGCGNYPHSEVSEFRSGYWERGQNTPAEFMVNSVASGQTYIDIRILRGELDGDRDAALKNVRELKRLISLGKNWPEKKPREAEIPYASDMEKSLTYTDEYEVNSYQAIGCNSNWQICWDEKYLHFAAQFEDNDLQPKNVNPWEGDGLEIFIMPERRLKVYREVVIPAQGDFYTALNSNNKWGLFTMDIDDVSAKGILVNNQKNATGFKIHCSIPWAELPGYMRGNTPKAGEIIHFMMVRTNKTGDEKATHSAMVPLLYGGHNIFGYVKATLTR